MWALPFWARCGATCDRDCAGDRPGRERRLSPVVDVTLEPSVPDRRPCRPYASVLNFHGANAGTCLHSGSEIRRGWGGVFALARILILCAARSEEHTSELQSLMRNSYAVFC